MTKMNITHIVNSAKFNRSHLMLLVCCCFIVLFDNYDLVIYSSVLPVIMEEWSMSPVQAGAIGSYGFFGMMVGAILFGIISDKFGRKNVIVLSIFLFSFFSFLCAFTPGPLSFSIFRFISGIGIGGVLPTCMALLTDYTPKRKANLSTIIMLSFFPLGGIVAGFTGIYFIPHLGWQSVYWIAAIPLIFLPFMYKYFHDSPAMLLSKGRKKELYSVLSKVNPEAAITEKTEFEIVEEDKNVSSPVKLLFTNNRALGTTMIWVAFFMCLLMINGLTTWLPKLMFNAGYELSSSLSFSIALNIGAFFGTVIFGLLVDKFGVKKVIIPVFLLASLSLTLLGFKSNMTILYLLISIAGGCIFGAQSISYSFVVQYYPSSIRSTGIGFASAIGRIGGIIGPTFGGILIALGLSLKMNFISYAIPGIIAAIAFSFVPLKMGKQKKAVQVKTALTDSTIK